VDVAIKRMGIHGGNELLQMRTNCNCCFFLIVFCSGVFNLVGQVDDFQKLIELYPDQPLVVLNKRTDVEVSYKKKKLQISETVAEDIMYLDNTARAYHDGSVYYGSFRSIEKIKAYSKVPKRGKPDKFRKHKVKSFIAVNVNSAGIFYDDQKELGFNYLGLTKGAKTHLEYKVNVSDPKFLGRNFFSYGSPTLESVVSIKVPENVEIGHELINVDTNLVKYTVFKKGKYTTHTWTGTNLKGHKRFSNGIDMSYYAPHIVIFFKSVQHEDSLEYILPDTKALYTWYSSIVKDVNALKSEVLKEITDSLLVGAETTEDKAKRIYYWVQDNIKYVAFEHGMGGFVPRDASIVCQRRFGDCKDMSSIIVEMLYHAGIDGNLTWIGTRALPYKYSRIHTPSVDNHMIASYVLNGKVVFLDAVGSYTPYGFTTSMIQGKEALIGISDTVFKIQEVPIVPKERNAKTDVVELVFDGSKLIGEGKITALGYSKLDFVYPLINLNDEKKKEKLAAVLEKGNNKFLIEKAVFKGLKDRDENLNLNYNFTVGNYVNNYNDELYINLHLDKSLRGEDLDLEKREGIPVKFDQTKLDTIRVSFKIPEGYKLNHVPPDESFRGEQFGFQVCYRKTTTTVSMEVLYYNNLLSMRDTYFEQWNQMIAKLSSAYQENIVFKKQ
jgi:hypothetical protein